jgi:hypothetical protein
MFNCLIFYSYIKTTRFWKSEKVATYATLDQFNTDLVISGKINEIVYTKNGVPFFGGPRFNILWEDGKTSTELSAGELLTVYQETPQSLGYYTIFDNFLNEKLVDYSRKAGHFLETRKTEIFLSQLKQKLKFLQLNSVGIIEMILQSLPNVILGVIDIVFVGYNHRLNEMKSLISYSPINNPFKENEKGKVRGNNSRQRPPEPVKSVSTSAMTAIYSHSAFDVAQSIIQENIAEVYNIRDLRDTLWTGIELKVPEKFQWNKTTDYNRFFVIFQKKLFSNLKSMIQNKKSPHSSPESPSNRKTFRRSRASSEHEILLAPFDYDIFQGAIKQIETKIQLIWKLEQRKRSFREIIKSLESILLETRNLSLQEIYHVFLSNIPQKWFRADIYIGLLKSGGQALDFLACNENSKMLGKSLKKGEGISFDIIDNNASLVFNAHDLDKKKQLSENCLIGIMYGKKQFTGKLLKFRGHEKYDVRFDVDQKVEIGVDISRIIPLNKAFKIKLFPKAKLPYIGIPIRNRSKCFGILGIDNIDNECLIDELQPVSKDSSVAPTGPSIDEDLKIFLEQLGKLLGNAIDLKVKKNCLTSMYTVAKNQNSEIKDLITSLFENIFPTSCYLSGIIFTQFNTQNPANLIILDSKGLLHGDLLTKVNFFDYKKFNIDMASAGGNAGASKSKYLHKIGQRSCLLLCPIKSEDETATESRLYIVGISCHQNITEVDYEFYNALQKTLTGLLTNIITHKASSEFRAKALKDIRTLCNQWLKKPSSVISKMVNRQAFFDKFCEKIWKVYHSANLYVGILGMHTNIIRYGLASEQSGMNGKMLIRSSEQSVSFIPIDKDKPLCVLQNSPLANALYHFGEKQNFQFPFMVVPMVAEMDTLMGILSIDNCAGEVITAESSSSGQIDDLLSFYGTVGLSLGKVIRKFRSEDAIKQLQEIAVTSSSFSEAITLIRRVLLEFLPFANRIVDLSFRPFLNRVILEKEMILFLHVNALKIILPNTSGTYRLSIVCRGQQVGELKISANPFASSSAAAGAVVSPLFSTISTKSTRKVKQIFDCTFRIIIPQGVATDNWKIVFKLYHQSKSITSGPSSPEVNPTVNRKTKQIANNPSTRGTIIAEREISSKFLTLHYFLNAPLLTHYHFLYGLDPSAVADVGSFNCISKIENAQKLIALLISMITVKFEFSSNITKLKSDYSVYLVVSWHGNTLGKTELSGLEVRIEYNNLELFLPLNNNYSLTPLDIEVWSTYNKTKDDLLGKINLSSSLIPYLTVNSGKGGGAPDFVPTFPVYLPVQRNVDCLSFINNITMKLQGKPTAAKELPDEKTLNILKSLDHVESSNLIPVQLQKSIKNLDNFLQCEISIHEVRDLVLLEKFGNMSTYFTVSLSNAEIGSTSISYDSLQPHWRDEYFRILVPTGAEWEDLILSFTLFAIFGSNTEPVLIGKLVLKSHTLAEFLLSGIYKRVWFDLILYNQDSFNSDTATEIFTPQVLISGRVLTTTVKPLIHDIQELSFSTNETYLSSEKKIIDFIEFKNLPHSFLDNALHEIIGFFNDKRFLQLSYASSGSYLGNVKKFRIPSLKSLLFDCSMKLEFHHKVSSRSSFLQTSESTLVGTLEIKGIELVNCFNGNGIVKRWFSIPVDLIPPELGPFQPDNEPKIGFRIGSASSKDVYEYDEYIVLLNILAAKRLLTPKTKFYTLPEKFQKEKTTSASNSEAEDEWNNLDEDLPEFDKRPNTGCLVYWNNELIGKTSIVDHNSNPIWEKERFALRVPVDPFESFRLSKCVLRIEVHAFKSTYSSESKELLGKLELKGMQLQKFFHDTPSGTIPWYPLQVNEESLNTSSVEEMPELKMFGAVGNEPIPNTTQSNLEYLIEVISAENLSNADAFGSANAFVEIIYNGKIIGTTQMITNSLSPVFKNEKFFLKTNFSEEENNFIDPEKLLELHVWSLFQTKPKLYLGGATISLNGLQTIINSITEKSSLSTVLIKDLLPNEEFTEDENALVQGKLKFSLFSLPFTRLQCETLLFDKGIIHVCSFSNIPRSSLLNTLPKTFFRICRKYTFEGPEMLEIYRSVNPKKGFNTDYLSIDEQPNYGGIVEVRIPIFTARHWNGFQILIELMNEFDELIGSLTLSDEKAMNFFQRNEENSLTKETFPLLMADNFAMIDEEHVCEVTVRAGKNENKDLYVKNLRFEVEEMASAKLNATDIDSFKTPLGGEESDDEEDEASDGDVVHGNDIDQDSQTVETLLESMNFMVQLSSFQISAKGSTAKQCNIFITVTWSNNPATLLGQSVPTKFTDKFEFDAERFFIQENSFLVDDLSLNFNIYNKNQISSDNYLGKVAVPYFRLKEILERKADIADFPVELVPAGSDQFNWKSGSLRLFFRELPDYVASPLFNNSLPLLPSSMEEYEINIHAFSNLPKLGRMTTTDCFAVITYGFNKVLGETSVVVDHQNPVWFDNQSFLFRFPNSEENQFDDYDKDHYEIVVDAFSYQKSGKHVYLGTVHLSYEEVCKLVADEKECHFLNKPMTFSDHRFKKLAVNDSVKSIQGNCYFSLTRKEIMGIDGKDCNLWVLNARSLPVSLASPNIYALLRWNGQIVGISTVIKMNSAQAFSWEKNEKFTIHIADPDSLKNCVFSLELWLSKSGDRKKDLLLGVITLTKDELVNTINQDASKWGDCQPCSYLPEQVQLAEPLASTSMTPCAVEFRSAFAGLNVLQTQSFQNYEILINSLSNLLMVDNNLNRNDVYVIVKWNETEIGRTYASPKSINPTYENQKFLLQIQENNLHFVENSILQFEVMNVSKRRDLKSSILLSTIGSSSVTPGANDEFLGAVIIKGIQLSNLLTKSEHVNIAQTFPLLDYEHLYTNRRKFIQGELIFTIETDLSALEDPSSAALASSTLALTQNLVKEISFNWKELLDVTTSGSPLLEIELKSLLLIPLLKHALSSFMSKNTKDANITAGSPITPVVEVHYDGNLLYSMSGMTRQKDTFLYSYETTVASSPEENANHRSSDNHFQMYFPLGSDFSKSFLKLEIWDRPRDTLDRQKISELFLTPDIILRLFCGNFTFPLLISEDSQLIYWKSELQLKLQIKFPFWNATQMIRPSTYRRRIVVLNATNLPLINGSPPNCRAVISINGIAIAKSALVSNHCNPTFLRLLTDIDIDLQEEVDVTVEITHFNTWNRKEVTIGYEEVPYEYLIKPPVEPLFLYLRNDSKYDMTNSNNKEYQFALSGSVKILISGTNHLDDDRLSFYSRELKLKEQQKQQEELSLVPLAAEEKHEVDNSKSSASATTVRRMSITKNSGMALIKVNQLEFREKLKAESDSNNQIINQRAKISLSETDLNSFGSFTSLSTSQENYLNLNWLLFPVFDKGTAVGNPKKKTNFVGTIPGNMLGFGIERRSERLAISDVVILQDIHLEISSCINKIRNKDILRKQREKSLNYWNETLRFMNSSVNYSQFNEKLLWNLLKIILKFCFPYSNIRFIKMTRDFSTLLYENIQSYQCQSNYTFLPTPPKNSDSNTAIQRFPAEYSLKDSSSFGRNFQRSVVIDSQADLMKSNILLFQSLFNQAFPRIQANICSEDSITSIIQLDNFNTMKSGLANPLSYHDINEITAFLEVISRSLGDSVFQYKEFLVFQSLENYFQQWNSSLLDLYIIFLHEVNRILFGNKLLELVNIDKSMKLFSVLEKKVPLERIMGKKVQIKNIKIYIKLEELQSLFSNNTNQSVTHTIKSFFMGGGTAKEEDDEEDEDSDDESNQNKKKNKKNQNIWSAAKNLFKSPADDAKNKQLKKEKKGKALLDKMFAEDEDEDAGLNGDHSQHPSAAETKPADSVDDMESSKGIFATAEALTVSQKKKEFLSKNSLNNNLICGVKYDGLEQIFPIRYDDEQQLYYIPLEISLFLKTNNHEVNISIYEVNDKFQPQQEYSGTLLLSLGGQQQQQQSRPSILSSPIQSPVLGTTTIGRKTILSPKETKEKNKPTAVPVQDNQKSNMQGGDSKIILSSLIPPSSSKMKFTKTFEFVYSWEYDENAHKQSLTNLSQNLSSLEGFRLKIMKANGISLLKGNKLPSPFCEVFFNDKLVTSTKPVKTSISPEWNESIFIPYEDNQNKKTPGAKTKEKNRLSIDCYDSSPTGGKGQFFGRISLSFDQFLAYATEENSASSVLEFTLDRRSDMKPNKQKAVQGKLAFTCQASFQAEQKDNKTNNKSGATGKEKALGAKKRGSVQNADVSSMFSQINQMKNPTLVITVDSAKELPSANRFSNDSDPFVVMFVGKEEISKGKTKVISNTLTPIWDETFKISLLEGKQNLHDINMEEIKRLQEAQREKDNNLSNPPVSNAAISSKNPLATGSHIFQAPKYSSFNELVELFDTNVYERLAASKNLSIAEEERSQKEGAEGKKADEGEKKTIDKKSTEKDQQEHLFLSDSHFHQLSDLPIIRFEVYDYNQFTAAVLLGKGELSPPQYLSSQYQMNNASSIHAAGANDHDPSSKAVGMTSGKSATNNAIGGEFSVPINEMMLSLTGFKKDFKTMKGKLTLKWRIIDLDVDEDEEDVEFAKKTSVSSSLKEYSFNENNGLSFLSFIEINLFRIQEIPKLKKKMSLFNSSKINSYLVIKYQSKIIHKTKTILNNPMPEFNEKCSFLFNYSEIYSQILGEENKAASALKRNLSRQKSMISDTTANTDANPFDNLLDIVIELWTTDYFNNHECIGEFFVPSYHLLHTKNYEMLPLEFIPNEDYNFQDEKNNQKPKKKKEVAEKKAEDEDEDDDDGEGNSQKKRRNFFSLSKQRDKEKESKTIKTELFVMINHFRKFPEIHIQKRKYFPIYNKYEYLIKQSIQQRNDLLLPSSSSKAPSQTTGEKEKPVVNSKGSVKSTKKPSNNSNSNNSAAAESSLFYQENYLDPEYKISGKPILMIYDPNSEITRFKQDKILSSMSQQLDKSHQQLNNYYSRPFEQLGIISELHYGQICAASRRGEKTILRGPNMEVFCLPLYPSKQSINARQLAQKKKEENLRNFRNNDPKSLNNDYLTQLENSLFQGKTGSSKGETTTTDDSSSIVTGTGTNDEIEAVSSEGNVNSPAMQLFQQFNANNHLYMLSRYPKEQLPRKHQKTLEKLQAFLLNKLETIIFERFAKQKQLISLYDNMKLLSQTIFAQKSFIRLDDILLQSLLEFELSLNCPIKLYLLMENGIDFTPITVESYTGTSSSGSAGGGVDSSFSAMFGGGGNDEMGGGGGGSDSIAVQSNTDKLISTKHQSVNQQQQSQLLSNPKSKKQQHFQQQQQQQQQQSADNYDLIARVLLICRYQVIIQYYNNEMCIIKNNWKIYLPNDLPSFEEAIPEMMKLFSGYSHDSTAGNRKEGGPHRPSYYRQQSSMRKSFHTNEDEFNQNSGSAASNNVQNIQKERFQFQNDYYQEFFKLNDKFFLNLFQEIREQYPNGVLFIPLLAYNEMMTGLFIIKNINLKFPKVQYNYEIPEEYSETEKTQIKKRMESNNSTAEKGPKNEKIFAIESIEHGMVPIISKSIELFTENIYITKLQSTFKLIKSFSIKPKTNPIRFLFFVFYQIVQAMPAIRELSIWVVHKNHSFLNKEELLTVTSPTAPLENPFDAQAENKNKKANNAKNSKPSQQTKRKSTKSTTATKKRGENEEEDDEDEEEKKSKDTFSFFRKLFGFSNKTANQGGSKSKRHNKKKNLKKKIHLNLSAYGLDTGNDEDLKVKKPSECIFSGFFSSEGVDRFLQLAATQKLKSMKASGSSTKGPSSTKLASQKVPGSPLLSPSGGGEGENDWLVDIPEIFQFWKLLTEEDQNNSFRNDSSANLQIATHDEDSKKYSKFINKYLIETVYKEIIYCIQNKNLTTFPIMTGHTLTVIGKDNSSLHDLFTEEIFELEIPIGHEEHIGTFHHNKSTTGAITPPKTGATSVPSLLLSHNNVTHSDSSNNISTTNSVREEQPTATTTTNTTNNNNKERSVSASRARPPLGLKKPPLPPGPPPSYAARIIAAGEPNNQGVISNPLSPYISPRPPKDPPPPSIPTRPDTATADSAKVTSGGEEEGTLGTGFIKTTQIVREQSIEEPGTTRSNHIHTPGRSAPPVRSLTPPRGGLGGKAAAPMSPKEKEQYYFCLSVKTHGKDLEFLFLFITFDFFHCLLGIGGDSGWGNVGEQTEKALTTIVSLMEANLIRWINLQNKSTH